MRPFDKCVFVNCPFDAEYRQMMLAMIFMIMRLGYYPRLALESNNSAETRISKIVDLIKESKFGLHDLSRMESNEANELARMNMPFELGLDYGCKHLKGGKWSDKRILVLDTAEFRYQAALSDIAGSDIRSHKGEIQLAMRVVRDWLVTEDLGAAQSHRVLWSEFNDFNAYLADQLEIIGAEPEDVDDMPVPELMNYMNNWFELPDT